MPIIAIVNLILFAALVSLLYQLAKNAAFPQIGRASCRERG